MDKLPWLDYAFGRAYRLVDNDKKIAYPAIYNGNAEYVSVFPNDRFGNFSWFDIYDPQEITPIIPTSPQYTLKGAIIFWYNLSSIYPDAEVLHTEEVKSEVLKLLTTPGIIKQSGRIEVTRVYERFENIYQGFSVEKDQDVDKQFFMYPYAGLRIEFSITTRELCQLYRK